MIATYEIVAGLATPSLRPGLIPREEIKVQMSGVLLSRKQLFLAKPAWLLHCCQNCTIAANSTNSLVTVASPGPSYSIAQ